MKKNKFAALIALCPLLPIAGYTQTDHPDFTGMWSDPPNTIEGTLCFFACFDGELDNVYALLDDPANDDKDLRQLIGQVRQQSVIDNVEVKLTARARETFPLDPGKDPSFTECIPWGFAREIFSPHQLRVEPHDDFLELQYGEWDITRRVYMRGHDVPSNPVHSDMGFSVAHYEGDTLVIETTHVNANIFFGANHSNQLTAVERFSKSDDAQRLNLEVTFTDPLTLTEPLVARKIWTWAPDQEIFPYDSCIIPDPDLIVEGV